jgi:hypothetical protein
MQWFEMDHEFILKSNKHRYGMYDVENHMIGCCTGNFSAEIKDFKPKNMLTI